MPSRWHVFHIRHRTPWYVSLAYHGMAWGERRVDNFDYHCQLYHINGAVAIKTSEFSRRQNQAWAAWQRDPQFLLKLIRLSYRDYGRFLPLWRKIGSLPTRRLSNPELSRWLNRYMASAETLISLAAVPLYLEERFTKNLDEFAAARLPAPQAEQAVQAFLTPKKEGAVGQEYRRLLQMALRPTAKIRAALERHRKNFAWMSNQLYTQTFHPLSYFSQRLQALQRKNPGLLLTKYRAERREHFRQYQRWLRLLKPDRSMRLLIASLNEAIYLDSA